MWIMRRKSDGQYFVKRRGDSDPLYGTGDRMTSDPNKACLYNTKWTMGYSHIRSLWEPIEVDVQVKIRAKTS